MSATKPRSTRPANVSPGFYWRSKAVVNQRQGRARPLFLARSRFGGYLGASSR